MVCKLCWNLLKVRLDSNTWVSMLFQASCTSGGAQPTQGTHWERCSMLETHHGWQIEAFFFSTLMHLYVNAHGIVLRHGLLGRHCPGSRAGIPWSAANPVHQEGHSRVLAKPLCFLLVRLRVRFCFLVPQTQQCLKKGTLSSLFTFKSVLTVWLTKEGCFKVCAENPSCCSLCSAESGWERERHKKAWAQSRFRALTLIFLALVGLS